MTNLKHSLENTMISYRSILPLLAGAALACIVLAAPSANAQVVSQSTPTVAGSAGGSAKVVPGGASSQVGVVTGDPTIAQPVRSPVAVNFTGPLTVTVTYNSNPSGALGDYEILIQGRQITGTDAAGNGYTASLEANLSRAETTVLSDTVVTTFSYQPATATGYLSPRQAQLTLKLSYNAAHAVVGLVSSISDITL